ncbi:hypothetical protein [Furfurilactobacillus curtus]|uniref:DUF771 domain-containing protein n=1 Tax=Furfurilactobacillus curtus TaxID=1746200 RepID=A0ABQ5JKU1_9LACO
MANSVDEFIEAKVQSEVTKRLAALSQGIPLLRPWYTTEQVMELTSWTDRQTIIKKFAHDPEVVRLGLVKRDGKGYFWRNPEFPRWLHDVYWRRKS